MNTLAARPSELIGALVENLDSIPVGDQTPELASIHAIMARPVEELRELLQKTPSVSGDPDELGRLKEALGRIVAWSRGHHEESVPALQNTMKLIHEEAANVLGWRAP